jgi:hypothetical protein
MRKTNPGQTWQIWKEAYPTLRLYFLSYQRYKGKFENSADTSLLF